MAHAPPAPSDTKPRSSRDDVLQFLDSLDSYSTPPRPATVPATTPGGTAAATLPTGSSPAPTLAPPPVASAEEAQSVLDFLDEITQRSSTPTAPVKKQSSLGALSRSASKSNLATSASRKSGESVRSRSETPLSDSQTAPSQTPSAAPPADGGWGWSSVWNQASSVVQQAGAIAQQAVIVAEEQVKTASASTGGIGGLRGSLLKALGENEQAKKWGEGVIQYAKGAHLDQIGKDLKSQTLRSLTDLLNAVAPPIAEHEVIEVSLSHDMVGYEGVETLVYRGLSAIMDEIEGGTLVVNKGDEQKNKSTPEDPDERNLNAVEGLAEGWKLAAADLQALITKSFKPVVEPVDEPEKIDDGYTIPVTTTPIYLRIQPCLAPLPYAVPSASGDEPSTPVPHALFFLLLLRDPTNNLVHSSLSQSVPSEWLDIPFEENEWVEDVMVDVIARSVQVIGKDYIHARMTAQTVAINKARDAAKAALGSAPEVVFEAPAAVAQEEEEAATQASATARII